MFIKYFINYKDDEKVKPFFIILPKMTGQARTFDEIKYMYFYIKYDKLLKKYNKIWNEVSSSINKGFDNKPVCSEKFLRFNIFLNGIPKEGYYYIFFGNIN